MTFSLPVDMVCSSLSTASWARCARRCTVLASMPAPAELPPVLIEPVPPAVVLVGKGDCAVSLLGMGDSVGWMKSAGACGQRHARL